jgi:uncharacterized protein CbrC (UPF0167 family)
MNCSELGGSVILAPNMDEPLPTFKYHPDPIATGAIKADRDTPCLACDRIRGYLYDGPVYSEKFHDLTHSLCPWCIADGSAAKLFGAEYADAGTMEGVSESVMLEVAQRTPGFEAWEQELWLTCCDDAAAYLGSAGASDLTGEFAAAIPAIEENWDGDWHDLKKDDQPTAYIFRCLHCQKYLAFVDET